jgi:hypothetical protein
MFMLSARKGLIKYFPEPMAVYRIHQGSLWSSQSKQARLKKWDSLLTLLLTNDFSPEVKEELRRQKRKCDMAYLMRLLDENKELFLSEFKQFLKDDPGLAEGLIMGPVLNYIWENKSSRSYKVAKQIGGLKVRLLKYTRRLKDRQ